MRLSRLTPFIFRSLHHFVFVILSCVYLLSLYEAGTKYHRFEKVLNEDAFGYYSILPAIFKYQDPQFRFLDSSIRRLPAYADYIPPVVNRAPNGSHVIKYYSGVALLQTPFYLAGDQIAKIQGSSVGYEPAYHFAVLASVVFYLLIGLFLCKHILVRFGLNPIVATVLPFIMLFGSNLLCYTTYDMAYSHVYSSFALVCFTYFLTGLKTRFSVGRCIGLGLCYGLILFIRPLNGVAILFVPIVFGIKGMGVFFKKENISKTLLAVFSGFAVLSIQSLLWFWQTGLFYVYPYGNEKLDLMNPRIFELVFGFDSGWAIYTPLPFLMLVVSIFILIVRKQYIRSILALSCSLSVLYLLSCWYYLHYGCTAGCRPITEFYGPLTILLGYSLSGLQMKKWLTGLLILAASILIYYNRVIHYQFYEHILNWCSMDKDKFSMVFMKTHPAYRYATSEPWDFSGAGKSRTVDKLHINKTLNINEQQNSDTLDIWLPPVHAGDSSVLLDISYKCLMKDEINESFVSFLLTNNGQYIDLQNFLLRRKVNLVDQYQEVHFEMLVTKMLEKGKLHISLESVNNRAKTTLAFSSIEIRKIILH